MSICKMVLPRGRWAKWHWLSAPLHAFLSWMLGLPHSMGAASFFRPKAGSFLNITLPLSIWSRSPD